MRRFTIYQRSIEIFFMLNLCLHPINKELLHEVIPFEIIGYSFWLSLGLYIGFMACKSAITKIYKEQNNRNNNSKDREYLN